MSDRLTRQEGTMVIGDTSEEGTEVVLQFFCSNGGSKPRPSQEIPLGYRVANAFVPLPGVMSRWHARDAVSALESAFGKDITLLLGKKSA